MASNLRLAFVLTYGVADVDPDAAAAGVSSALMRGP